MRYHAIPLGLAWPRCFPAVHSARKDGVMEKEDLMTSIHVLLEHEGATRNLNGEVKLGSVPKIMA